ncbi:hypothetical protein [Oceanobacillus sp. FSL H7-0719]|uniref:hypothetical protein n=1 Tax=Oceanobacillus sp. FSL H7-0719 TaxID=2954507 RepID=UPI0032460FF3
MVRKGDYTYYDGKEYRLVTDRNGKTFLISNDSTDIKKGFQKYSDGVFQKEIDLNEIGDIYYIHPYAIYNGEEFDAKVNKGKNTVKLGTSNSTLATKMGFDRVDKYYYEKNVSVDKVNLFEKKKVINKLN